MRKVPVHGAKMLILELFALVQSGLNRTNLGPCPACRTRMELPERQPADDRHKASLVKCPLCSKEYQISDLSDRVPEQPD
jgi:hypothetical protein